ncbi:MAG: nucleoside deaminase [Myxococcales bacterium]|nr:nucleoside deaminase [Myxococcales bacterium]
MEDEQGMREAIAEAQKARASADVPVGAIVVFDEVVIVGRGHNRREADGDPTAHAEMIAIREAAHHFGRWRLIDCALYVTQEPCPMCAGAIVNSRIDRVIYGCDNPKAGAVRTLYRIADDRRLNHRAQVTSGVLAEECSALLMKFFKNLRSK